jgi:hypothetical protein
MGSRSLDATAGTQGKVVSGSLGSTWPPGFSLGWRALALRISRRVPRWFVRHR